jgi:hypothetical protein
VGAAVVAPQRQAGRDGIQALRLVKVFANDA